MSAFFYDPSGRPASLALPKISSQKTSYIVPLPTNSSQSNFSSRPSIVREHDSPNFTATISSASISGARFIKARHPSESISS
ncbi:hypothetical protein N9A94_08495, partial [Akkermansiaceae bacterium]|nr:hypothetical protein [Akkermansiaceae bacterium]